VSTAPVSKPAPAPVAITTAKQSDIDDLDKRVSTLEQAISGSGQAEENLQQQIAGLSTAIGSIQNNLAMLTQQMGTFSTQAQQAQTQAQAAAKPQVKAAACQKKTKPKIKNKTKWRYGSVFVSRIYYVRAMIQGRAWLMTSDGTTFTVSDGDNLPGYGQVQTIDPAQGVVLTSSGRVINYRPQDR
jgi:intracellular multiplication protein IcmG